MVVDEWEEEELQPWPHSREKSSVMLVVAVT